MQMYLYTVEMRLDVPLEPGESATTTVTKRVVATDVERAVRGARLLIPEEVCTTTSSADPPYRRSGPMRPVRTIRVVNCAVVAPVDEIAVSALENP